LEQVKLKLGTDDITIVRAPHVRFVDGSNYEVATIFGVQSQWLRSVQFTHRLQRIDDITWNAPKLMH
jgi:hypothetical protein